MGCGEGESMTWLHPVAWSREQWMLVSMMLIVVIVVLLALWPRGAAPDHITVRVIDSSQGKVYSTQTIPLR
jgi:hypothetical protein